MEISQVSLENVVEFVCYCRRYGAEHDESFLPDDAFVPTDEFPAYLLFAGDDAVGAVGLMRTRPYRDKGKARLTIFHTLEQSPAAYASLLTAIRQHTDGLREVYGFLPEAKADARQCWEALGFVVERYAYLLVYLSREVLPTRVPEGYSLVALAQGDEVGIRELCDLWNRNYGQQPGFVGATPEYIVDSFDSDEHIPGGTLLLRHGLTPVATVRVFCDDVERKSADVAMLSVHPDYRGQGLGRLMLRKALEVALRNDLSPVYLSVNAENASAVALYLSEGFTEDTVLACYTLALRPTRVCSRPG
jgi:ribosomal protein S18 acetylase RimI-like enzyme